MLARLRSGSTTGTRRFGHLRTSSSGPARGPARLRSPSPERGSHAPAGSEPADRSASTRALCRRGAERIELRTHLVGFVIVIGSLALPQPYFHRATEVPVPSSMDATRTNSGRRSSASCRAPSGSARASGEADRGAIHGTRCTATIPWPLRTGAPSANLPEPVPALEDVATGAGGYQLHRNHRRPRARRRCGARISASARPARGEARDEVGMMANAGLGSPPVRACVQVRLRGSR